MTAAGLVRRRPKSQSPFPDLDGPPAGLDSPPAGRPPAGRGGLPARLAGPPAGLDGPPASPEDPPSRSAEDAEDRRPMYSWNPSDPTETFPAVRPPGDSRPG
jgi:hypothetical protein